MRNRQRRIFFTLVLCGFLVGTQLHSAVVNAAKPSNISVVGQDSSKWQTKAKAKTPLSVLAKLKVKGRAPKTGYSRSQFGSAWKDVDRNGCDTRNDVLGRDFSDTTFKAGTGQCKVIGGMWTDPYSNVTYTFDHQPSELDADHVVALSDAWQKGAAKLSKAKRIALANDPLNVVITSATLNRQKGDGDAATWLPPLRSYRCAYVARQIAVKAKYKLWVTKAEKRVMKALLTSPSCKNTALPNGRERASTIR
ncbi:MAG: DUF1524 domain-containing protein [Actinobacteria bacterium]|uniref:Unannotated protein n=1 Tax=freshwater metagenome TaxID=449393 RepID=A0A6J5ZFL9_9ZZZZ|nr:DUF1524 domain-containing protein [Actinomycetota bacterium]